MINQKDNFTLYNENAIYEFAMFSSVGGRPEQEDSSGYELEANGGITVICDGMGGHNGGKLASSLAVSEMLRLYLHRDQRLPVPEVLMNAADLIDRSVSELAFSDGTRMQAGTTIICSAIEGSRLHILSVGDSRIYLIRGGTLFKMTTDHNYLTKLNMELSAGKISRFEYDAELPRGEALVSFLGVGGLSMIDCNTEPFKLMRDDMVLMTTDGMYKILPESEIQALLENFSNISDAIQAMELKVRRLANQRHISRDNMTVAIIKIK